MNKKKFFFLIIILFASFKISFAEKIIIKTTVNNEIITNYDIKKEGRYLKILNPQLSQVDDEKVFKLAKQSLVNEIIKRKEIAKNLKTDGDNPLIEEYFKNLYTRLNFENKQDFENSLKSQNNYSPEDIKKKLQTEIMWNELIYLRFSSQVKINKQDLLNKINKMSNKQRKEYLLSEIVFQKKKDENFETLKKKISESILEIGFNNTANIFSISESAKLGGKIGWINENNLSEVIQKNIKNKKENEITDVILIGNNYLIIKIEKVRSKQISIDKDEELEKMVKFERNNQLNKFSRIYFNKVKVGYSINER